MIAEPLNIAKSLPMGSNSLYHSMMAVEYRNFVGYTIIKSKMIYKKEMIVDHRIIVGINTTTKAKMVVDHQIIFFVFRH